MRLYEQQRQVVNRIMAGMPKNRIQCLAWYTGAGKTNCYIAICEKVLKKNPKAKIGLSAYLTTEIRDQIAERFREFGLGHLIHVIEGPEKHRDERNITIFNPQSMVVNIPEIKFDVFIIDEAHVGTDESCTMLRKIMLKTCTKKTRVLLGSATPWDTLALKEFKDAKVYKRSLDQGLQDGLITDFNFVAEEAQIDFMDEDFSRKGDLTFKVIQKRLKVLKSTCIGKLHHLITKYDKRLGDKVVVICPPGNVAEIATSMAEEFDGLAFVQDKDSIHRRDRTDKSRVLDDTSDNLRRFKEDPDIRFLFVVNKCQTGFDYKEMTSIIDMTMTRNVKLLMQRTGRIARKNGAVEKNYFYVYDRALGHERLEWLVMTMVDLSLGNFDGVSTRSLKYRGISTDATFTFKESAKISEIIKALSSGINYKERRDIKFVQYSKPRAWTVSLAKDAMAKFKDRTDMWANDPGLYKWLRVNAKEVMDEYFPLKVIRGKWNEQTVITALKAHKGMSRKAFKNKFGGVEYWISTRKRQDLYDKYLVAMPNYWNEEKAMVEISKIVRWGELRKLGGLRKWCQKNGGEMSWKERWMNLTPKKAKVS